MECRMSICCKKKRPPNVQYTKQVVDVSLTNHVIHPDEEVVLRGYEHASNKLCLKLLNTKLVKTPKSEICLRDPDQPSALYFARHSNRQAIVLRAIARSSVDKSERTLTTSEPFVVYTRRTFHNMKRKLTATSLLRDAPGIGRTIAKRLAERGFCTAQDLANCAPDALPKLFGQVAKTRSRFRFEALVAIWENCCQVCNTPEQLDLTQRPPPQPTPASLSLSFDADSLTSSSHTPASSATPATTSSVYVSQDVLLFVDSTSSRDCHSPWSLILQQHDQSYWRLPNMPNENAALELEAWFDPSAQQHSENQQPFEFDFDE